MQKKWRPVHQQAAGYSFTLPLAKTLRTSQHQGFLNEFEDDSELKQTVLEFFFSLPLWIELEIIRVVHGDIVLPGGLDIGIGIGIGIATGSPLPD